MFKILTLCKLTRFTEARRTEIFSKINDEETNEYLNLFHKMTIGMDGHSSWDDAPCDTHGYVVCKGDFYLNWKDKGYVTVFDLLKVCGELNF